MEKPLILIADDQQLNQKLFSIIMDKLGYPSIYADDGQDALDKVKGNNVALIFMDLQMPKMGGYEATYNLRQMGYKIPVIAVTATVQPDEAEQCRKAGIDDLLFKPVKRADVEAMLAKWLGAQNHAEAGPVNKPAPAEKKVYANVDETFDAKTVLANFLNDRETVLSILARFIDRTQNQIDNFMNLVKAGDFESARRDAHSIKGSALTMGGSDLGKAASRLELAFINNSLKEEIDAAFSALCETFKSFKNKAEEFMNTKV